MRKSDSSSQESLEEHSTDPQPIKIEICYSNASHTIEDITATKSEHDKKSTKMAVEKSPPVKMGKFAVYKNLLVVSLSFVLLFTSLMSFSNIQSTINIEEGLGTTGLAVLYAVMVFTSLFVTLLTLPLLGYKTMMVCSMFTYVCYVATGFYSSWYTVVPGSVIVGIGASHLWPTQQAYITQLATVYATNTETNAADMFNFFFGVFFGLFYTCQIWGNLFSSIVFGTLHNDLNTNVTSNLTSDLTSNQTSETMTFCGPNFCAMDVQNESVIEQPPQSEVNIFTGFCVGVSVLAAVLILLFLTNLQSHTQKSKTTKKDVLAKVSGVVRLLMTSPDQQLLIPITVVGGITMAFVAGDFTVAFVSCPYGVGMIGFVMITYGVSSSFFSFLGGKLSKQTGAILLIFIGLSIQTGVCVAMLLWIPKSDQSYIAYILAALWAIGDATNQPLSMALYSAYFIDNLDSAMSSLRVLNSLGWAISFGYSSWICTSVKVYILIGLLVISLVCLVILHFRHKQ